MYPVVNGAKMNLMNCVSNMQIIGIKENCLVQLELSQSWCNVRYIHKKISCAYRSGGFLELFT